MFKRLKVLFTVLVIMVGMVGCNISDNSESKTEKSLSEASTSKSFVDEILSDNTESEDNFGEKVYMNIWSLYYDLVIRRYDSSEKAYVDVLNSNYSACEKLIRLNAIYFNSNEFTQYGTYNQIEVYTGKYCVENNFIIPQYNFSFIDNLNNPKNKFDKFSINYSGNNSDEWYDNTAKYYKEKMETANLNQFVLNNSLFIGYVGNDKEHNSHSLPRVPSILGEENNNKYCKLRYNTKMMIKGRYLVAIQEGYSISELNDNGFTISFDNSDLESKNGRIVQGNIVFNDDNTWESIATSQGDETSSYGEWKMLDDNLLVIYSPLNCDVCAEYGNRAYLMLYIDFDNKEVYIPAYVQCDDALDVAREYQKELEKL